jgi:hypothetical protein
VRYVAYPFAVAACVIALINFSQVVLSRQVIRPQSSRRSPRQIRHDSFATGIAVSGLTLGLAGVATGAAWLVGPGFVVIVIGYSILFSGRGSRSRPRSRRSRRESS